MNYTLDEIMDRLQKGDTIETIGNEFAELLNKAEAAHKAKIQEDEKAKMEVSNKEARMCILHDIVDLLVDYSKYTNMALTEEDLASVDLEDIDKSIMSMLEMAKALAELKELSFPKQDVQKVAKMSNTSTMSADEALRKFLAGLG